MLEDQDVLETKLILPKDGSKDVNDEERLLEQRNMKKKVNWSELQIWSLQNLSFQWNSSSYLEASYFRLCKYRMVTICWVDWWCSRKVSTQLRAAICSELEICKLHIWSSLWLTWLLSLKKSRKKTWTFKIHFENFL